MSRLFLCALAGCAIASLPVRAHASPSAAKLASWLDNDAAVVMRLEPSQLENIAAVARSAGGDWKSAAAVGSMMSRGGLGFDVFDSSAWTSGGLGAPVLIQLAAIDAKAAGAIHRTLSSTKRWSSKTYRSLTKTYLRARLVVPTTNQKRAKRTLSSIRALPQLYPVGTAHSADIAQLFGAEPRNAKAVVKWLEQRDVFVAGWIDGLDAIVVGREVDKSLIVVDVFASFGGVPITWDRDKASLAALIERGGNGGFSKRVSSGGGTLLTKPGIALWISARQLLRMGRAVAQLQDLRAIAAGDVAGRSLPKPRDCKSFRWLARKGAFYDLAVRISPGSDQLDVNVAWGLRKGYGLADALETWDRGLPSPTAIDNVSASATLYLRSLQKLRALPRPDDLSGSWEKLWASVARCRSGSATVVALFGWPQVLALFLDELAALDATAEDTVAGFESAGVALTKLAWKSENMAGAGEIAFDKAGARAVESFADALFGKRTKRSKPRKHVTWGRGVIRPFSYDHAPGKVVGASFGGADVSWRLGHRVGKRDKKPPLLRGSLAVSRALSDLGAAPLGRALASKYGKTMLAVAVVRDGVLMLSARAAK